MLVNNRRFFTKFKFLKVKTIQKLLTKVPKNKFNSNLICKLQFNKSYPGVSHTVADIRERNIKTSCTELFWNNLLVNETAGNANRNLLSIMFWSKNNALSRDKALQTKEHVISCSSLQNYSYKIIIY